LTQTNLSTKKPDYLGPSVAQGQEEDNNPYFHILMPNWWGDVIKEGYGTSLVANAIDLTAQTNIPDIDSIDATKFDNYARGFNENMPDFMRKSNVSEDYSTYSDDILFDIGATVLSIFVDAAPIHAAGAFSAGSATVAGYASKGLRFKKIANKIQKRLPAGIETIKKGFQNKGVVPQTVNKVAKSLYNTFSDPSKIIQSGNTLGIYGASHDIVNQKLDNKDGASWMNKIDEAQTVDAFVSSWKAGAAFPIGSAVGKPLLGTPTKHLTNYMGGSVSKSAGGKALQKGAQEVGDLVGGGYAFVVPEEGFLPSIDVLAHSIGTVGGLKGIGGLKSSLRERSEQVNRAFQRKNLSENQIDAAQAEIGMRIKQEVTDNTSVWRRDGVELIIEGQTAKGNIRYRESGSDKISWMNGDKFFKENKVENIEAAPESILNSRIESFADALGAFSPKAKSELYYDGAPPKLTEGKSGLSRFSTKEKYELAKKLQTQKIGRDVLLDLSVQTLGPRRIGNVVNKAVDFLTIDLLNKFPQGTGDYFNIRSMQARIFKNSNPSPLAKSVWRKLNAYPSLASSWLGTLSSKNGLNLHFKNKNLTAEAKNKTTEDLEHGILDNQIAKDLDASYKYVGSLLREKGIIGKDVPLELNYSPHYLRGPVKEALNELQSKMSGEYINGREVLDFVGESTRNKNNPELSAAEQALIEKATVKWLETTKSPGAKKLVEQYLKNNTVDGKINWTKSFEQLNKELIALNNNPFHNFKKGRSTDIKWDKEQGKFDADIFETDAILNKQRYLKDAADAIAIQESFGNNMEIFGKNLETLQSQGRDADVRTLRQLMEVHTVNKSFFSSPTRTEGGRFGMGILKGAVNSIEAVNNIFTGSLVAFGLGPANNLFQASVSTAILSGYLPHFKSGMAWFSPKGIKEKERRLQESGVKSLRKEDVFQLAYNSSSNKESWHRKVAEISSRRPVTTLGIDFSEVPLLRRFSMSGSTQAVHEQSVLAGFESLNYLMNTAKTGRKLFESTLYSEKVRKEMEADIFGKEEAVGSARIERNKAWAREKLLQDFNFTYTGTKPTNKQAGDAAIFYADMTQLKRNPASEAYYMSHPATKSLFRLKSFVIKQTKLIHDNLALNMKYGNHGSLLRIGLAGAIGQQYNKYNNALTEYVTGEDQVPRYDEDSWVDGVLRVGLFGLSADILAEDDKMYSLRQNIKPFAWAMGEKLIDDFQARVSETRQGSFAEQVPTIIGNASKYFGGPLGKGLSNFKSTEQKIDGLTFKKGLLWEKLFKEYEKAFTMTNEYDRDIILKRMDDKINEWNLAYGHLVPFDGTSEGFKLAYFQDLVKKKQKEDRSKGLKSKYVP